MNLMIMQHHKNMTRYTTESIPLTPIVLEGVINSISLYQYLHTLTNIF